MVERSSNIWMCLTEGLFSNGKRSLIEGLGSIIQTLLEV